MKTVYHGTVKEYLPSILKNGLRPSPSNAWKLDDFPGSDLAVYFTTKKQRAIDYAKTKAEYLAVKPDSDFYWQDAGKDLSLELFGFAVEFHKAEDAPVIKTEPVLLAINLTDEQFASAQLDYDDHISAYVYPLPIPPSQIEVIQL